MSVISEEVIARDIEEFEKQKHLLNTPVQVNARILLVESICIPWSWWAEWIILQIAEGCHWSAKFWTFLLNFIVKIRIRMRWSSWVTLLMAKSHWLAVRRMRWSYWLTGMLITLIGCLKREAGESHWLISVSRRLDPVRGQPFCQQQSRHCGPWGWKGMLIALIGCLKREAEEPHWLISVLRRLDPVRG